MKNGIPGLNFECEELHSPLLSSRKIKLLMARLDKLHPVVSGNKLFKLHFFIEEALATNHKTILTFGGAYSNHLVATAWHCRQSGLKCIGIVRGEEAEISSHSIQQCRELEMETVFVSRAVYTNKDDPAYIQSLKDKYGDCSIVPEGGYHPLGAKGASLIMDHINIKGPQYICTATGTATTLAGLLQKAAPGQTIVAIPVIRNMTDIPSRLSYLLNEATYKAPVIFDEYHFGGYAKRTAPLISFMNEFYGEYRIPTDFVYTAKMMYGILDRINQGYFADGSTLVCLHTGGLQGNDSLATGTLIF